MATERPGPSVGSTAGRRAERVSLWLLRAGWLGAPFTVGAALADAFHDLDEPIRSTASWIAWLAWAAGLAALAVPRAPSLTVVRIVVPGALAAAGWANIDADVGALTVASVALAAAATALALSAPVTDAFVDGSSYGPERRVGLKVPPMLLLGPIPLTWSAATAGVVTGPLLLAARQWVLGALAVAAGGAVVVVAWRALNQLSRRWLVYVPAGVVVHDPLALREPVLFQRHTIAGFGPAPVDAATAALDLTKGAAGLVLHLDVRSPVDLPLARSDRTEPAASLLLAPGRPGVAVAEAAARRITIA